MEALAFSKSAMHTKDMRSSVDTDWWLLIFALAQPRMPVVFARSRPQLPPQGAVLHVRLLEQTAKRPD